MIHFIICMIEIKYKIICKYTNKNNINLYMLMRFDLFEVLTTVVDDCILCTCLGRDIILLTPYKAIGRSMGKITPLFDTQGIGT